VHPNGSIPIDHVSIGHHQSQRPVSRGFPLFKRCEWLVSNRFVFKRRPPHPNFSALYNNKIEVSTTIGNRRQTLRWAVMLRRNMSQDDICKIRRLSNRFGFFRNPQTETTFSMSGCRPTTTTLTDAYRQTLTDVYRRLDAYRRLQTLQTHTDAY